MTLKHAYACIECKGEGEITCEHCGHESHCSKCNGSGLDETKIDIKTFENYERALMKKYGSTSSWIVDDIYIGRAAGDWKEVPDSFKRTWEVFEGIAFKDFPPKPKGETT